MVKLEKLTFQILFFLKRMTLVLLLCSAHQSPPQKNIGTYNFFLSSLFLFLPFSLKKREKEIAQFLASHHSTYSLTHSLTHFFFFIHFTPLFCSLGSTNSSVCFCGGGDWLRVSWCNKYVILDEFAYMSNVLFSLLFYFLYYILRASPFPFQLKTFSVRLATQDRSFQ